MSTNWNAKITVGAECPERTVGAVVNTAMNCVLTAPRRELDGKCLLDAFEQAIEQVPDEGQKALLTLGWHAMGELSRGYASDDDFATFVGQMRGAHAMLKTDAYRALRGEHGYRPRLVLSVLSSALNGGLAWREDGQVVRTASSDGQRIAYFRAGEREPFFVQRRGLAYAYENGRAELAYDAAGRPAPLPEAARADAQRVADQSRREREAAEQAPPEGAAR